METYKAIFSGRLEFGNARSYEKALQLFESRVENYYRKLVLLKTEEIFDEATFSMDVPRLITQANKKIWRNTIDLLDYIVQYSIAGNFRAWMTLDGQLQEEHFIEPCSDKAAVQAYLKGRQLVQESGKEGEAKRALDRAIEKFERHALAYERRGKVNFALKNLEDAIYDFSKSIDINPNNAEPFLGRATVYISQNQFEKAIKDLDAATKTSIPHQPIYWKARRLKGECYLKLHDYQKAAFEFRLFCNRTFQVENPNFQWRKQAFSMYGKALLEMEDYGKAIEALNKALSIRQTEEAQLHAEQLLLRGIARQKAGEKGFTSDWEKAAGLGSKRAAELLATQV